MSSNYSRGILATVWVVTGLATISLSARLYTRYWRFSKFYWDDAFVIAGWVFALPMSAQLTLARKKDTALFTGYQNIFLTRPITLLFFYNSLWAIKISFLIFFRRIGVRALPAVRKYWTVVFFLTVAAYFGAWLLNPYDCWVKKGLTTCDRDPAVARFTPISLSLTTVFDVVTDCLIIAIPFAILTHLRITRRQKLILYALFSVEIIIIAVAIVRVVIAAYGISSNFQFQITVLLFLSHVEANTAIIVACAGTLRSPFTQREDRVGEAAPWDSRPPNHQIVRPQRGNTTYVTSSSLPQKISDDETVLTSMDGMDSRQVQQPPKPYETDAPLDLGHLLKREK